MAEAGLIFFRKNCPLVLLVTVVLWSSRSAPQGSTSSAEIRFKPIIQEIERILPTLADHGAGLFALARLYAQTGDKQKALALLKESLATDDGFDPNGSEMLAPLRSNADFAALAEQAQRRYPPVHNARIVFTVPDKDLFPEGLAYDPAKDVFTWAACTSEKSSGFERTAKSQILWPVTFTICSQSAASVCIPWITVCGQHPIPTTIMARSFTAWMRTESCWKATPLPAPGTTISTT